MLEVPNRFFQRWNISNHRCICIRNSRPSIQRSGNECCIIPRFYITGPCTDIRLLLVDLESVPFGVRNSIIADPSSIDSSTRNTEMVDDEWNNRRIHRCHYQSGYIVSNPFYPIEPNNGLIYFEIIELI